MCCPILLDLVGIVRRLSFQKREQREKFNIDLLTLDQLYMPVSNNNWAFTDSGE